MSTNNWEEIEQLAERSLQGDPAAYRAFLSAISTRLKPRFYKMLPEAVVDDALQETLMAVHKSLHTLDVTKPIAPWLNAIAHYKIQDQLRVIYKVAEHEELKESDLVSHGELEADGGLNLEALLGNLSERDREVLKLLKIDELMVLEVSQRMGMSASNVK